MQRRQWIVLQVRLWNPPFLSGCTEVVLPSRCGRVCVQRR
jgi:hypothetical protein